MARGEGIFFSDQDDQYYEIIRVGTKKGLKPPRANGEVKIHYPGWSSRYDEWVSPSAII
ncbi:hypothetical protein KIPB_017096, partial [Kipferlia bialata]|eukprot:g17096.t1